MIGLDFSSPEVVLRLRRMFWAATALLSLGLISLVVLDTHRAWIAEGDQGKVIFQLAVYWGTCLLWPALIASLWRLTQSWHRAERRALVISMLWLMVLSTAIWARFIEPKLLRVQTTQLSWACGVRVALISDLHLGLFWREHDLTRLVHKLNSLEVDAVLVAGDWTIEPPKDLAQVLAPLRQSRHRMLSVTGNHDEENPGPALTQQLLTALSHVGVESIEAKRVALGRCELVGLGDLGSGSMHQHLASLKQGHSSVPAERRVVLTHDPDTAAMLPPDFASWVFAGHTHGGQIDLPFATDWVLGQVTQGRYRQGVYVLPHNRLFVTSGLGMSNLPFRLRVMPTIDVLML